MSASVPTPASAPSYASVADMIARYGEVELIRDTTPLGQEADTINAARVGQALADASSMIDSYLRRQYVTPVANPPSQIGKVCCELARVDLATNGVGQATKPQLEARKTAMDWLRAIGDGKATLDGLVALNPDQSFARTQDRSRFGQRGDIDRCGGFNW